MSLPLVIACSVVAFVLVFLFTSHPLVIACSVVAFVLVFLFTIALGRAARERDE